MNSAVTAPVAIVTGGGTGIGRAICLRLAHDGFRVVVAYAHSAAGAEETVARIQATGGTAFAQRADITDEAAVIELFAHTQTRYGQIDAVINNAGIGYMKAFTETSLNTFDRIFAVNARGSFTMLREAARCLQDGGRIVNISSDITSANPECMALYAGSKAAMETFSKVLARELAPRLITVNCISPGMVDTPMLEQGNAENLRMIGAKLAAMQRLGQPEDIADAVAMLVSRDGRWITGQNIRVDGGTLII